MKGSSDIGRSAPSPGSETLVDPRRLGFGLPAGIGVSISKDGPDHYRLSRGRASQRCDIRPVVMSEPHPVGDRDDAVHVAQDRFLDQLAIDHHKARIGGLELGDDATGAGNLVG